MFRTFRDVIDRAAADCRDCDYAFRESGLRRRPPRLADSVFGFRGGQADHYPVVGLSRRRGLRTR